MNKLSAMNISIIKDHYKVIESTTLKQVYDVIKSPESPYRATVEEIRRLYLLSSAEEAKKLKKELIGFTGCGIFNKKRTTKNLTAFSGYAVMDLDNLLPQQIQSVLEIIKGIPYTYIAFISPGGLGIKVIVQISCGAEDYKIGYQQIKKCYEDETGEIFDKTCDIARLTYISYDPDAYINESNAVYQVTVPAKKEKIVGEQNKNDNDKVLSEAQYGRAFELATDFTNKSVQFDDGSRHNFLLQLACNANRYGISLEYFLEKCIDKYADGWSEEELAGIINNVYNNYTKDAGIWIHYLNDPQKNYISNKNVDRPAPIEIDNNLAESTPTIPLELVNKMPEIIKRMATLLSNPRERDVFVTGALCVLSGCLYSARGIYDGDVIFPNLFSFIIAPAASGKGVLKLARHLGNTIHQKLLQHSKAAFIQYKKELNNYYDAKKNGVKNVERPSKPAFKILFVPGNSSCAAIYDHLNDCDGIGIICESEADTITNCQKNEWGNYSDLFRKAAHHETISSRRKAEKEYIEIAQPKLSAAITGTPSQVPSLVNSTKDGSFSRFLFYRYETARQWRDVSPANGKGDLPRIKEEAAKEVEHMVEYLNNHPTQFHLTESQWSRLNKHFEIALNNHTCFDTDDAAATIMRLGLNAFRIAMIFSTIRKYELKNTDLNIICTDEHFTMALQMVDIYLQHALVMFKEIPSTAKMLDGKIRRFFEMLPAIFDRKKAIELSIANNIRIEPRTVDKYLKRLVDYSFLIKSDYNEYRKIVSSEKKGSTPDDTATVISLPDVVQNADGEKEAA